MTSRTALGWWLMMLLSAAAWAQPNAVPPETPVEVSAPAKNSESVPVEASPANGPENAPTGPDAENAPENAPIEVVEPAPALTVARYLTLSQPMLARRAELEAGFRKAVAPLRRRQELQSLRGLVLDLDIAWDDLHRQVAILETPTEAALHHQSLLRLVEVAQKDNALLLETIDRALALTTEIRVLKEAGADEEARRARIAEFTLQKEPLAARLQTARAEVAALEATLEAEQARLAALEP